MPLSMRQALYNSQMARRPMPRPIMATPGRPIGPTAEPEMMPIGADPMAEALAASGAGERPVVEIGGPENPELANALIAAGYKGENRGPWEALGNLAQVYSGTKQKSDFEKADKARGEAEKAAEKDRLAAMAEALAGSAPTPVAQQAQELIRQGYVKEGVELLTREPKGAEPFTLSPGQTRFGPDGQPISNLPPEAGDDQFTLTPGQQRFDREGNPIAGVTEPSKVMSPEEFDQQIKLREAGKTSIVNNLGPTGIDYGEPEKGYAWQRDAGGTVAVNENGAPVQVPIGGGSVEAEAAIAEAARESKEKNKSAVSGIIVDDADRALAIIKDNPTLSTGFIGDQLRVMGGTNAADLEGLIDSLIANIGFERLEQMRSESPSGAALGAVQVRELEMLQSVLGSLKQKQSAKQLAYNIKRFKNLLLDTVHGPGNGPVREALEAPAASEQGPQPGAIEEGFRFKGGDPGDANNWERAQ